MAGFLEPSRGNATVGGYDIRHNLDKVRENLGLCPQHDVLFDVLTVKEHLEFFGRVSIHSVTSSRHRDVIVSFCLLQASLPVAQQGRFTCCMRLFHLCEVFACQCIRPSKSTLDA